MPGSLHDEAKRLDFGVSKTPRSGSTAAAFVRGADGRGITLVLLMSCLWATSVAFADQSVTPAKWINVRDCGATGSEFETLAETTAGSHEIILKGVGDFRVGQQVIVQRCNPRLYAERYWNRMPKTSFRESLKCKLDMQGLPWLSTEGQVQVRGYDGSLGNRAVFILDFAGTTPPTFRFSDDMRRTWKQTNVPVTGKWQKLSAGVEVKLGDKIDWSKPCVVTFKGSHSLVSAIKSIEGNKVTLADPVPITAQKCSIVHADDIALQTAFDRAAAESRSVFIPSGRYRLTKGLVLRGADGITVEGENEERTILDIRSGEGTCITIKDTSTATLRKLRLEGFSGFAERHAVGGGRVAGSDYFWGFVLQYCSAVKIYSAERVLVDRCHARGMSGESFYSLLTHASRRGRVDPPKYTKSVVYQYCSVMDCARNAFNNNDYAENTSVLYCYIKDVGGCAWEGSSRFVKFTGNYIRNAGVVTARHNRGRHEDLDVLPAGQHIITDNTFEGGCPYGAAAISVGTGPMQVIVTNNIFVNFNSNAIRADGATHGDLYLPARNVLITGNAIDLTCAEGTPRPRCGISVSTDDTTVADNQIYVRADSPHPKASGIVLSEPARNIVVHDNLIRNCGTGLSGGVRSSLVKEATNPRTFSAGKGVPSPRRKTHCYRDCRIAWREQDSSERFSRGPRIKGFDPEKCVFVLAEDAQIVPGRRFAVYSPHGLNWNIHHNTVTSCLQPVRMDVFGGLSDVLSDNILSRGVAKDVHTAVEIRGLFKISDNQFVGFNEPGSTALRLRRGMFGEIPPYVCRGNVFGDCAIPVKNEKGVWEEEPGKDNTVLDERK